MGLILNILEKLIHILMIITGSYEMERIRALRNHPDYDYYGNYIGEERTDIKIVQKQNTKKIKTTLKEAA